MKKLFSFLLVCLAVFSGINISLSTAAEDETVNFAFYGPLTGDAQQYGQTMKAATEIAVKHINENGGVLGKQLTVDFFDDQNDPNEAVNVANNIVSSGKYSAVIGSFGTASVMAAAPIFEAAQLINYSPSASHAELTSAGEYVFQNYITQAYESEAYADFLYNELGIKTIAIMYIDNDYGNNVEKLFKEKFEELGGEVVYSESFIPGQTNDFSPMLTAIKEKKPDAYYPIAFYEDSTNIVQQANNLGLESQLILASNALTQATIDLGGENVEGAYLMNAYSPDIDNERFKKVYSEYEELTDKPGDLYVMLAYDVTDQIATAINEVSSLEDKEAIKNTLLNMKDYDGLAGEYSMSETGSALRTVFPIKIENGKFIKVK